MFSKGKVDNAIASFLTSTGCSWCCLWLDSVDTLGVSGWSPCALRLCRDASSVVRFTLRVLAFTLRRLLPGDIFRRLPGGEALPARPSSMLRLLTLPPASASTDASTRTIRRIRLQLTH